MKKYNLNQRDFFLSVIFIFAILLLGCAKDNAANKREILFGWAGSPDNPHSKSFDYFYMKSKGNSSAKAIEKKSKFMMEQSCIEHAIYIAKVDLAGSIVLKGGILADCNSICGCSGCIENPDDFSEVRISIVELVACPTDYYNPALSELFNEIINKIKVKYSDCKPTTSANRNFQGSEWKECECTVYVHIPGGRKSIWEQCIELEKKFESKR